MLLQEGKEENSRATKQLFTHKIFNTPVPLKLISGKLPALGFGALVLNALDAPQDSPVQADDALSLQKLLSFSASVLRCLLPCLGLRVARFRGTGVKTTYGVEAEHVLVLESPVGGVGPPRQDAKHRHNIERA